MPSSAETEGGLYREGEQPDESTAPEPSDDNTAAPAAEGEAPQRSHPTNAVGEEVFPLADAGEYYVGLWNDYPKYGCPVCAYTTLADRPGDGDFAVDSHIQEKAKSSEKHREYLANKKGANA